MPTKKELRQKLRAVRLSLSLADRQLHSHQISANLESAHNWSDVTKLHVFEPIKSLKEVDISFFTSFIKAKQPHIKLFTSRQFNTVWQVCNLNKGQPILAPQFDVVIVPMLGFDDSLNRIGYGGGYYDKLLAAQAQTLKIGVCYEAGKISRVPIENHDIKMDLIVTEKHIYR